jgi:hypothetical protein
MVAIHWVKVLATGASASGSSSVVLESSIAASGIQDTDHASANEPCSGL